MTVTRVWQHADLIIQIRDLVGTDPFTTSDITHLSEMPAGRAKQGGQMYQLRIQGLVRRLKREERCKAGWTSANAPRVWQLTETALALARRAERAMEAEA